MYNNIPFSNSMYNDYTLYSTNMDTERIEEYLKKISISLN